MKVVLIKSVPSIGNLGDVKEVSNGHALNYLIPQKIALPATEKNIGLAKHLKNQKQQQKKSNNQVKKSSWSKLDNYTLLLSEKADDSGTFFAGITRDKIAIALQEKGFPIKAKQIEIDQAIKKAGSYKVKINLHSSEVISINVDAKAII